MEIRPYPGHDTCMWDGLYAANDGKVYTGLISEGDGAHFYVYDPAIDRNVMVADIADFLGERGRGIRVSCKIHNKPVEDDAGRIYFVPLNNGGGPRNVDFTSWRGGHWLRYDPATKRLENLGLVAPGDGIYPLAIDRKRMLLFGVGFTGYLYRFDIENRTTTNLGRVANWDVSRDIFCDDEGNVYGSFPVARIWKYDAATGRVVDLSLQMPYDPAIYPAQLNNPMIDRTYDWRAVEWDPVERAAYGVTCGSGSILFRFDPHAGKQGEITPLARMCDSRFLEGDRKDIPYSTLAFALDSKNRLIYFVPSARRYSIEQYEETFASRQQNHLIMYDINAGLRVDLGALAGSDGRKVFGCEAAGVAPDGTLYICGQAEAAAKQDAAGSVQGTPVALHMLIYRPVKETP